MAFTLDDDKPSHTKVMKDSGRSALPYPDGSGNIAHKSMGIGGDVDQGESVNR